MSEALTNMFVEPLLIVINSPLIAIYLLRRAFVPKGQTLVWLSGLRALRGKAGAEAAEEEEAAPKKGAAAPASAGKLQGWLPPPLLTAWSDMGEADKAEDLPVWLLAQMPKSKGAPQPRCGVCKVCDADDTKKSCNSKELFDKTDFAWYSPTCNFFLICPLLNEIAVLQPIIYPTVEAKGVEIATW